LISKGESNKLASICYDVTAFKKSGLEKEKMKKELVQAQKLESVGQLAVVITHEINTPSQFISDNLTFLQESVGEILELIERIDKEKENAFTAGLKALMGAVDMSYIAKKNTLGIAPVI
jgi:phosphoglycerate-specific signal transduction histidine kinase